jgi:hypothetical protein
LLARPRAFLFFAAALVNPMTHTQEIQAWDRLPGTLQITTQGRGLVSFQRASQAFRLLASCEKNDDPLLAVEFLDPTGRWAALPAQVGALNIYLGTIGLAGLRRTLGPQRARPKTHWDLAQLFKLCGIELLRAAA